MADTNVRVMARVNPKPGNVCLQLEGKDTVVPLEGSGAPYHHKFHFDNVFPQSSKQDDVFEEVGVPTIDKILLGYNGTVFAYGQTGSGKTHTMLAPEGGSSKCLNPKTEQFSQRGLIPRMAQALFERLEKAHTTNKSTQVTVTASFYEIYNEELIDLLSDAPPPQTGKPPSPTPGSTPRAVQKKVRMEGTKETFKIVGLESTMLSGPEDLLDLIQKGTGRRHVASTNMNSTSSRSHSIIQINVVQNDTVLKNVTTSQLNLVDLAGCESLGRTGAKGQTALEGTKINLSLTTLGIVINQLCKGEKFISFRDSMLTRVLQNSLGGNTLTTLIVTMSQLRENYADTLSVLRFAERAKQIKNKARVNKQRSAAEWELLYKQAEEEMETLRQRLALAAEKTAKSPGPGLSAGGFDTAEITGLKGKLERCLEELEEARSLLREKEAALFESDQRLDGLNRELDDAKDEMGMLSLDKSENQAMYESTLENLKKLELQMQAEQKTKEGLQFQVKTLGVEIAGAREETKLMKAEQGRRDVSELETNKELQARLAEITALKREVALGKENVVKLKGDMDYASKNHQEETRSLNEQIQRLKAVGGNDSAVGSALQSALDQQDETMALIKKENATLREETHELRQKMTSHATAVSTAETETEQCKKQVLALQAIIDRNRKTHEEMRSTVKRYSEDIARLKQENLTLAENHSSDTAKLEVLTRTLETEKTNLQKELDHLKDDHGNCRREIEERDAEIQRLRDRIRELEHDNSALEDEAESNRIQVHQLGKECNNYSGQLKDKDSNDVYVQDILQDLSKLVLGHKSLSQAEQEELMEKLRKAMEPRSRDMLDKLAARLYDETAQSELVAHVEAVMEDRSLDVEDMKQRLQSIVASGDVVPETMEKNIVIVKRQLSKVVEILEIRTFHSSTDESLRIDLLAAAKSLFKTVVSVEEEVNEFQDMNVTSTMVICPFCSEMFDKDKIKVHVQREHS